MYQRHWPPKLLLGVAAVVSCGIFWYASSDRAGSKDVDNASLYVDFLKTNDGLCATADNSTMLALIAVFSDAAHFDRRSAVRRTWGRIARRNDFRLIFVLARPRTAELQIGVDEEGRIHGDLVQLDAVDAYDRLTVKSASTLRWFRAHCPRAEYLLKIDDDCFLNSDTLARFLGERSSADRGRKVIYGMLWTNAKPFRSPGHKWYLSPSDYPPSRFPDYINGPAYLVSGDAVGALVAVFDAVRFIHLEDVYVTGLCAKRADVQLVNVPHFLSLEPPTSCSGLGRYVAFHDLTISQMDLAASMLFDTCPTGATVEIRKRNSGNFAENDLRRSSLRSVR